MKLTADQYFLHELRASDVQSPNTLIFVGDSSVFVSLRDFDNAKCKQKYREQPVQMYLCQWLQRLIIPILELSFHACKMNPNPKPNRSNLNNWIQ